MIISWLHFYLICHKLLLNLNIFQVNVPIDSNDKCKQMILKAGRHEVIPEIFMCAGYDNGGRDSCQVNLKKTYNFLDIPRLQFQKLGAIKDKFLYIFLFETHLP